MFNIQCSTLVIFGGIFIGRIRHLVFYDKDIYIYIYIFVNRIYLKIVSRITETFYFIVFFFVVVEQRNTWKQPSIVVLRNTCFSFFG